MELFNRESKELHLPEGADPAALVYHHAPDPMFLFRVGSDGDYRCISANRAYLNRMGLSEAEVVGKRIEEVLPESEVSFTVAKYRQVSQARQPIRFESGARGASVAQTTLAPILDAAGHCVYLLGIDRDITEFKRAEIAERERRIFAETLRGITAMVNGTLDLDQVLEQILINVGRVVPHDAANILLLDADGSLRLARGRGYESFGGRGDMQGARIEQMPLLKRMIETQCPVAILDVCACDAWNADLPGTEWIRAYAGAPLRMNGRVIGFLNLDSATTARFTPVDAERLQSFADQITVAIENARLHAQVRELAIVDELTGLYNRRGLFQFGEYEVHRAVRNKRPLSVILLDIDRFKNVNDTYGHSAGDVVLRDLAECCREGIRGIDIVARYGGEEFVVLLPETDVSSAKKVAERLRCSIQETLFIVGSAERGDSVRITVSLGVVGMHPAVQKLAALIECADHAQYRAKNSGGNAVVAV
ncbi:MAG: diguanylate cyclase [Chloroflexi bacterium]|nr:diguanylate cyclase [Chloroflexota bacterium]